SLLQRLARHYRGPDGRSQLAIYGESCSDAYGPYLCGQLGTTYFHHEYAFPELYHYTFPEQRVVDMVYPFRSQGMRASPVSYWWRELLDRAFLTGMNFWIYDDEEYGSFRHDPIALAYVRNLIRLRNDWYSRDGRGG